MSGDRAIDPLPLDQFPQEADTQDPGFEQLFADSVGDFATDADGFDVAVQEASALLDAIDAGLAGLAGLDGGNLDDTFLEMDELDPTDAGQHVIDLQAALPGFQSNVDNLGVILGGPPLPGPVPGGGGGRPATCGMLDMGAVPFQIAGNVNENRTTVQFTNNYGVPLTIKSVTWTPPQAFGFQIIPPIDGSVIQPGAQLAITIYAANGGTGVTQATLTLNTDGPDPQPCVNVTATWLPASGGGGTSPITNCVKCADWACPGQ